MPENNSESENSNSSRRIRDAAREEALATQLAAGSERFKMTEEEKDDAFRCVRRLNYAYPKASKTQFSISKKDSILELVVANTTGKFWAECWLNLRLVITALRIRTSATQCLMFRNKG